MSWLLTADVLWEAAGLQPDVGLQGWLDLKSEESFYLSTVSLGELAARAAELLDLELREQLQGWLRRDLPTRFGGRLLGVDAAVALRWGELRGSLPPADAWIAATALEHDLAVVTPHGGGLQRCGVRVESPWLA